MASHRPWMERSAAFRRFALSLENAFSMGWKSGAVGPQEQQLGTGVFDGFADGRRVVAR